MIKFDPRIIAKRQRIATHISMSDPDDLQLTGTLDGPIAPPPLLVVVKVGPQTPYWCLRPFRCISVNIPQGYAMLLTTNEQFQAMIAGLEDTGMTRNEIASKVGCSRMHIWRLGVGDVQSPRHALVVKISNLAEQHGVSSTIK
ncbi:MAG TPA: hypothetical protein VK602_11555 [Phyllobacterium sp.]|nr:hypothetical protein [Phyllobacterium sp.]